MKDKEEDADTSFPANRHCVAVLGTRGWRREAELES